MARRINHCLPPPPRLRIVGASVSTATLIMCRGGDAYGAQGIKRLGLQPDSEAAGRPSRPAQSGTTARSRSLSARVLCGRKLPPKECILNPSAISRVKCLTTASRFGKAPRQASTPRGIRRRGALGAGRCLSGSDCLLYCAGPDGGARQKFRTRIRPALITGGHAAGRLLARRFEIGFNRAVQLFVHKARDFPV